MIKSFIFSIIISAVFVAGLIGGQSLLSTDAKEGDAEFALIKSGTVSLASDESNSESKSEAYPLLLGKDGTIIDARPEASVSAQTKVSIQIVDPDNYSYQY